MTATIATPARAVKTTAGVELLEAVAISEESLPLRPVLRPAATERMAVSVLVFKWEEDVIISSWTSN